MLYTTAYVDIDDNILSRSHNYCTNKNSTIKTCKYYQKKDYIEGVPEDGNWATIEVNASNVQTAEILVRNRKYKIVYNARHDPIFMKDYQLI